MDITSPADATQMTEQTKLVKNEGGVKSPQAGDNDDEDVLDN